ncbi:hypothetical protein HELRODRAFT_172276 [Helobdella robusta]|uniref:Endonuclease/exonuclease/phosphatase domain-containing protein n=1 Tax=Helobdella robusta TaxID=6412 RepID=T1F563_HELRO|nr:hypothetical protein HELRODRAFT_172276 [Helobdella robusta]ESO04609.1 hypothetical protein HELRODRAFT_172276 [Helobdella robusta]
MVDRSLLHCRKNANNTMVVQKKYAHTGSDVARVNKVRAAALETRGCSVKYATESQKDRLKMGLTVGVWNVRSLWQTGAYALMKKELERFRYDVVGLCEVRWTGGGEMEGGKILWSGTEREHVYGVGMVIGEKAKKAPLEYNPVNERMMYARFKGYPRDIDVVVAYAPTMDHSDAEIEAFYDQLEQTLNVLPKKDVKIITGDWNAKIGRDNIGFEEVMGKYGIGNRNNRGERKTAEICKGPKNKFKGVGVYQAKNLDTYWQKFLGGLGSSYFLFSPPLSWLKPNQIPYSPDLHIFRQTSNGSPWY